MPTLPASRRTARALAWSTAVIAAVLLVLSCSPGAPFGFTSHSGTAASPSPFPGATRAPASPLYASPDPRLLATAALLKRDGHPAQSVALAAIARTPAAVWAAGQPGEMQRVRQVTQAAMAAHATAVIVAYNIPDRDSCGKFSSTPGPGNSGYKKWINQLAAAIGTGQDIVIVEPDALPDLVRGCLNGQVAAQRYLLLKYAMRRLGGLPNTNVYLDAGNPGMFSDPAQLSEPLIRAGIRYGRGFSANVSNFQWTATMVHWSQRLESALGGQVSAVIDTSRNLAWPGRDRRVPLDQGSRRKRRRLQWGARGRPVLCRVRRGAGRTHGRGMIAGALRHTVTRRGDSTATHDAARALRLALSGFWLLDAALQFQPFMFTKAFGQTIAAAAMANARLVATPIVWNANLIEQHPALWNGVYATTQLLIAAGIAWRRTERAALGASIAWSLAVWWFGEGLGGMLTGMASPLTGAPGAVTVYELLAVLLWPASVAGPGSPPFVAARTVGSRAARLLWLVFWMVLAATALWPRNRAPQAMALQILVAGDGEPGWLAALDRHCAVWVAERGLAVPVALACLLGLIAVARWLPAPAVKPVLILAIALAAVIWVLGEAFGGILTGRATDPNTGPLLVLLTLAYWPVSAVETGL
jgi:hypothetical protein